MKTALAFCALMVAAAASQPALATTTSTTAKKVHHHAIRCSDKVLCHKIDNLSAAMNKNFQTLGTTVTAGQTEEADYHTKSLAIQTDTLAMTKSIEGYESQGAQVQHAIFLSFDDKPLAVNEDASSTATKVCTDAGFKAGKPVDITDKHYVFRSSEHLLKSVVCTY